MNTTTNREELKQIKRLGAFEQIYEKIMPMDPDYDPTMCRDAFLRQLFVALNIEEFEESESRSTETSYSIPANYYEQMALTNVLQLVEKRFQSTKKLDSTSHSNIGRVKLSVMSGRKGRYDELLETMRRSSLFYMFLRTTTRLSIMLNVSLKWGDIDINTLPHSMFTWSMDAFFHRCKLATPLYLEVLTRNYSTEKLDWAKFSIDLIEILRYFKYFLAETFQDKGHESMLHILNDQQTLLHIGEQLDENLKFSLNTFEKCADNSQKVCTAWWSEYRDNMSKRCRIRAMDYTVRLPIEWRYARDHYATHLEMQILKDKMPVDKLENEIKKLKDLMQKDLLASNITLAAYAIIIENYWERIDEFSEKIAEESAQWEHEIHMQHIRLIKAQDEYKEAEAGIIFMRQRVKEVQAKMEADQLSADLKLANAQAEVEKKAKLAQLKSKRRKSILTKAVRFKS